MKRLLSILLVILCGTLTLSAQQNVVRVGAKSSGKTFEGIGVVNGGGATAVLLKDYPEPQRSQMMDLVYKPMFAGSVSSILVEIPGDGNSTQGSMPAHSHFRGDNNPRRGYMWWVMQEAKKCNPLLPLDATAWSAPGWVGSWWSKDMADFYISWLYDLREVYGLELDAIGCHNEKGKDYDFAKLFRKALNERGFSNVRLHGFDNWGRRKLNFLPDMLTDKELCDALDIVSAHTFSEIPISDENKAIVESLGKPLWNTEDHIYKEGFDALISIVKCFNENYIVNGATKVINYYDIAGVYPMQPHSVFPATIIAHEPWSGHYQVREALWGYAHYGQFTELGWQYVDDGCKSLAAGGSMVTLKNPATGDFSIIVETKDAEGPQTLKFSAPKGFSRAPLCVWYSTGKEQFVRLADIRQKGGRFTLTLQPNTVYSISTTRGQQKGSFDGLPASMAFPMPYADDFDSYTKPDEWGWLPHYTADILGAFELAQRPDMDGMCLRQVVGQPTLSWAPKWHHYTILGDVQWQDYEVSADVWLNPGDEAGVMGRVCNVGIGYGVWVKGYYMKIDEQGNCSLIKSCGKVNKKELIGDAEQQAMIKARKDFEEGGEFTIASSKAEGFSPCSWHTLKIRFEGDAITGYVDGVQVVQAVSEQYGNGMAGLIAPMLGDTNIATPYFDNLTIRPLGRTKANNNVPVPGVKPLYPASAK